MNYASKKKSMDVLHIIGAFIAGGAETFVTNLTLELNTIDINAGILALSNRSDCAGIAMRENLSKRKVFYDIGAREKVGARAVLWYLKRIKDLKPKIIHLHTENTELVQLITKFSYLNKYMVVRTLHTANYSEYRLHRFALHHNKANVSIACGDAVHDVYRTKLAGELITINNGVNFNWPIQTAALKDASRRKLNLRPEQIHFVNVGSQNGRSITSAAKAHDVLIRAWQKSKLGTVNCILNLIGSGGLQSQLMTLAGDDASIVFHGITNDIPQWLLAADCFVMPSRCEGLPIAGIEAVGTGLKCIFSNIKPLTDLVGNGVTIVGKDDVMELSYAMRRVIDIPLIYREDDTLKFRDRYNIKNTAIKYKDVYKSII